MEVPFRSFLTLLRLLSLLSLATSRVLERHQSPNSIRALSDTIPDQRIDVPTSFSTDLEIIGANPASESSIVRTAGTEIIVKATSGQRFFVSLADLAETLGNDAEVTTSPAVNWVSLDHKERIITGLVPGDYPAGLVTISLTVRSIIAGEDVQLGFCFVLDICEPASISVSTANSIPTSTAGPASSGISVLPTLSSTTASSPATTTSVIILPTATDALSTSTTTTSTASRTIPTSFPTATVIQGQPFAIGFDPYYRYSTADVVGSASTNPQVNWIRLDQPPPFRALRLIGDVPATQPPGPIAVTLSIYGRGPDVQGQYTLTFTVIVVAATTYTPP